MRITSERDKTAVLFSLTKMSLLYFVKEVVFIWIYGNVLHLAENTEVYQHWITVISGLEVLENHSTTSVQKERHHLYQGVIQIKNVLREKLELLCI